MKLLMVIDSIDKGGKERRMLELVKALTAPGQDYEICLVLLNNIIAYEYVHQLPIRLEILPRKSRKDLSIIFKLRKIIKDFNPDVIHSWGSLSSVCLSVIRPFTRNSGFINGTIADTLPPNLFDVMYLRTRFTAPFSKVILANSQEGLRTYKVAARKAVCIYNGIDLGRFEKLPPPEQMELAMLGRRKGDSFIAAMVGAFEVRKDYDTLIKAAVSLCQKNKKVVFLLVGEGSLIDSIKQQVPAELMNKQIIFTGSRHDIEAILQIIDVGLLIAPYEGISNSIMEYMASYKPVIGSRAGGIPEVVADGETGFLVDQKRSDQIVEKIELLMANPELAHTMGQKGRQRIEDKFNLAKMRDAYIGLYEKYRRKPSVAPITVL